MDDAYAAYGVRPNRGMDFDRRVDYGGGSILPDSRDSLDELIRKQKAWARIVSEGGSLAAHFGYLEGTNGGTDWTANARKSMDFYQMEMWDIYVKKKIVPEWDHTSKLPQRPGEKPKGPNGIKDGKKRDAERVVALERLYKKKGLTVEHLYHWESTHAAFIPLLIAVVKLDAARRQATSGTAADPRKFQESLAVKACVAAKGSIIQRAAEQLRAYTRESQQLIGPVHSRGVAVEEVKQVHNRKKDPVGEAKVALGGDKIGAPARYEAPAGAGRIPRGGGFGLDALNIGGRTAGKRPAPAPWAREDEGRGGKRLASDDGAGPSYRPRSPPRGRDEAGAERGAADDLFEGPVTDIDEPGAMET